ncbi:MAG: hypothetical protein NT004_04790 [Bacteroidetes bacterium]|nr:hypothetical protein [Bacteroidota bacterium]
MEKEEVKNDDYLSRLIRQIPLESPSDDFVNNVMAVIQSESVVVTGKKSFFPSFNSALPYVAVILFCIVIFATSDLPFLNRIPAKGYFLNDILPYFGALVAGIKAAFTSKYVTWGLLVGLAGGLLFFVDRFLSRRSAI